MLVITRRLDASWPAKERIAGLDVIRVGPVGRSAIAERRALAALAGRLRSHRQPTTLVQIVMWPDAIFSAAAAGLTARTAVLWAIDGEIEHTLGRDSSLLRRLKLRARRAKKLRIYRDAAGLARHIGQKPQAVAL